MHQLVQSAIEASRQGNKNKAMGILKQALTANPNDVEAMLALAGLIDEPDRKRQVLNRVLKVDPVNRLARDELLKLDRQAMGTFASETNAVAALRRPAAISSTAAPGRMSEPPAPVASEQSAPSAHQSSSVNKQITQPVLVRNSFLNWVEESPTVKPQVAVQLDGYSIIEKPLVFKYPLLWRILMYFFLAFFGCVGLLVASQNIVNSLPFLGLALLMGLTAMAFSPKVEVSEAGLRASGMFSDSEILWDEIAGVKSIPMKRRLELSRKDGKVVNVSTQVSGYPRIVEIIRQRRPDLFGGVASGETQNNPFAVRYGNPASASAFTETKTFRKSFFTQYAMSFLLIPVCVLLVWSLLAEPQYRIWALLFGSFCAIMMVLPFFQPGVVKVEPDKLTIETFLEQKEFSASQIKDIKMQSVRGRRGTVTHFMNIIPVRGRSYSLQGFSDGDEIIYGTLINWWESYRDQ